MKDLSILTDLAEEVNTHLGIILACKYLKKIGETQAALSLLDRLDDGGFERDRQNYNKEKVSEHCEEVEL